MIGECNRLGMIVDGAHVSHDGIRLLLDVSEAPILLSHSNAFTLCDHPRNAPDDVLKRLKANGGVVMATFVPGFVSQAVRDWLTPHARRLRQGAAGERSEGAARRNRGAPRSRRRARRCARSPITSPISSRPRASIMSASAPTFSAAPQPVGLEHVGCFPNLFAELVRRGFSERDLEKISSRNVLRVMRKVEEVGSGLAETREPALGRSRIIRGLTLLRQPTVAEVADLGSRGQRPRLQKGAFHR